MKVAAVSHSGISSVLMNSILLLSFKRSLDLRRDKLAKFWFDGGRAKSNGTPHERTDD